MSVLKVKNLGKAYRKYKSEWMRIARWFGLPGKASEEHWVLRGVDFSVEAGEAVAIVGQNGAGKSTLLKMITGTLQPSEGSVQISGRISAILELGMGFNPELSGRQNAIHTMGLLGFSSDVIKANLGAIEDFADIGEYFNQQVRMYSSGMQARLAFSVATAIQPEIIIVDEALAVGDAAFQRKCFRRLERFVEEGTALLFVSHDLESVKALCDKALLIAGGTSVEFGDAKRVCDLYEKMLFGGAVSGSSHVAELPAEKSSSYDNALVSKCEESYGDGRAVIESIWLEDERGEMANVFPGHVRARICCRIRACDNLQSPILALMIKTREGVSVFGTDSKHLANDIGNIVKDELIQVSFAVDLALAPGTYYLNCGVRDSASEQTVFLHRRVDALLFRVTRSQSSSAAVGLADLSARMNVEYTR